MSSESITLPIAFLAGLLSFVSPCVLPLVPAYVGYLGGAALSSERVSRFDLHAFLNALVFVAGFMLIFIALGATASAVGQVLSDYAPLIARAGGALLLAFGLRVMGVQWKRPAWLALALLAGVAVALLDLHEMPLRLLSGLMVALLVLAAADLPRPARIALAAGAGALNLLLSFTQPAWVRVLESLLVAGAVLAVSLTTFFYAEKRFELRRKGKQGYLRSLLFGLVFAAGWTPCVGPILAGILILASQADTVGQGVLLLAAYGLGLGIPFLLVGLLFGSLGRALRHLNRYLNVVSLVSGLFLAAMGVLVLTSSLPTLTSFGSFLVFLAVMGGLLLLTRLAWLAGLGSFIQVEL